MTKPRKSAGNARGKPFQRGNPGKPKGTRHRATRAVEQLMEGQAEALTQKAIDAALAGDMTALRLCLDRIAPPRKGRPVDLKLPKVETAADAVKALATVIDAIGQGDLTPDEGQTIANVIEVKRKTIETAELEARITALEGMTK
jgi:hypothetical protein